MTIEKDWNRQHYYGRYNKYPFTEVVSFVMRAYGAVPDRSKVRILDLGCGGAHHLLFLAQEGFDYHGIDGASESVEIARYRLSESGFKTDTLVCGTFGRTPYPDDFFDCVIDRGSLVCNRLSDLPALIAEMRRILKPGGRFFSMILNEASTAKERVTSLGDNDYTDFQGRLKGAGVLHFTNAAEARRLFSAFNIEDIELILRKSEYSPSGNKDITAWTVITCSK